MTMRLFCDVCGKEYGPTDDNDVALGGLWNSTYWHMCAFCWKWFSRLATKALKNRKRRFDPTSRP